MWVRYVDDTFVLWPDGEQHLKDFHQHLNSQHPAIQFTMEREQQKKIAFLDVAVERKPESFVTSVYRKPTHTDRYINFASHHHHPRTKSGVISCSKRRADESCDPQLKSSEINHLKTAFIANGYPRSMITQAMGRHKQRRENQEQEEPHEKPKILYLPYIKNTSEEIERECRRIGVKGFWHTSTGACISKNS